MKFTKMEGCGNDYIYIDGAAERIPDADKPELVRRLSDRHFGIGGDGVIFINPSDQADFEMEMYNADGSRGKMCGNGIRCVAKYVYDKGLTSHKYLGIISAGSVKKLQLSTEPKEGFPNGEQVVSVRVDMGEPILRPDLIPVRAKGEMVLSAPIIAAGKTYAMTCVSMGNPHAVIFLGDDDPALEDLDLEQIGPQFEHHEVFPEQVNTEFVTVTDRQHVEMRVWERGSGETWACGTGACAVVVAAILNGLTDETVAVRLRGGELEITWDRAKNTVFMTGPAVTVFEGQI